MTYAELQAAVISWLQRDDVAALVPTWISFVTKALNRELRVPEMESRDTPASPITTEFAGLPSDFLEIRAVADSNGRVLKYLSGQQFASVVANGAHVDPPIFSVEDFQLRFYPAPTASTPLTPTILYYERIPDFVASGDSNWVSDEHPDIYVYGALKHARAWVHDEQRLSTAAAMYAEAVETLKRRKVHATGIVAAVGSDLPRSTNGWNIQTDS